MPKPAKYKTGTRKVKLADGRVVTVRVYNSKRSRKGNRRGTQ